MGRSGEIDHNTLLEKVFSFGEEMAKENGVRLIIMIDEFPSMMDIKNKTKLGEGIIRKIRTIHEKLEYTILCITGSIRRTMEIAALSPSSAFYRQFIVKNIGPFNLASTKEVLEKNLGKKISKNALDKVYELTGGIPFYLQFLGRELGRQGSKAVNLATINEIFEEFLSQEANLLFSEQIKSFSDKENIIISRMACHDFTTPAEVKKTIGESSNVICRYMDYFLLKGVLEKEKKGVYRFTDPVFKEWLKRRFVPTNL
jgi:AAA+ ATPase superfamily predicted ATPase